MEFIGPIILIIFLISLAFLFILVFIIYPFKFIKIFINKKKVASTDEIITPGITSQISKEKNKFSIMSFVTWLALLVVSILIIIAFYFFFSGGGLMQSSKIGSTKANHAQAARLIQAELKKCEIQGENLSLKSTASNTTVNSVVCSKSFTSTEAMIIAIVNHLNNENFKNPYNYKLEAFTKSGSTIGQTVVTSDGATIALTTRYKDSNDGTIKILETFIKDNRFN
jgi:hypothetical protein